MCTSVPENADAVINAQNYGRKVRDITGIGVGVIEHGRTRV